MELSPTFTQEDEEAFRKGVHPHLDEVMGGRLVTHEGVDGAKFAVWAPCALSVHLVGDFNGWDEARNSMELMGSSGVWECFVPGLKEGEKYKFAIRSREGHLRFKADPYAYQGEMRPNTASVLTRIDHHQWQDDEWMAKRSKSLDLPLNIYELHLGAWKKGGEGFMGYRECAPLIADYVKKMGYTHVELMPVMGHPFDESWGYQVSGYYAISRRYGTVTDFQFFVDYLHSQGIGLILDWVPGHFPSDEHSLIEFDGTCLYEHVDKRQGYHPRWNTHIFNFGRVEVANFLVGSALFYLDKMHIDGLRVDAVSSIVFLDFERKEGEWVANREGGNINFEGVDFLKRLNKEIGEKFPSVWRIAEESHAYPGVTSPEGLGFDLRWDLGWMNDALKYFQTPHAYRSHVHHSLVHEMSYYYDERHLLPLSHDEVVHEKKSLLSKMPGNEWEKFANLRLLLSYMICHPGKKLLFMGGEFGQWQEWDCKEEIHWDLLAMPYHHQLQYFVSELNTFYASHPALFRDDFSKEGFQWISRSDDQHLVLSYLRHGEGETLLCIHHFSPEILESYFLPIKNPNPLKQIFSTDSKEYGGCGIINKEILFEKEGVRLTLPPLSTLILSV